MLSVTCLIAVVVPFYQREAGLLRRAVASAIAQTLPAGVQLHIIVVDDGSPLPAREDLQGLHVGGGHTLQLVEQANGGPGRARNTGLDAADRAGADVVAFLDSDDVWRDFHLGAALERLGGARDFYFCNYERLTGEASKDVFAGDPTLQAWLAAPLDDGSPIRPCAGFEDAFVFQPGAAFDAFLVDYLAQTATVVFRRTALAGLRFDTRLRVAGEDHLFWLAALARGASACFSTRVAVECGEGLNLYYSALDWDHPNAARRIADRLSMFSTVQRWPGLSPHQREVVRRARRELEPVFGYLLLRSALRGRLDSGALGRAVAMDASLALRLPYACAKGGVARWSDPERFGRGL